MLRVGDIVAVWRLHSGWGLEDQIGKFGRVVDIDGYFYPTYVRVKLEHDETLWFSEDELCIAE